MNELFCDKTKVYSKIKDILFKNDSTLNSISADLSQIDELKDQKSVVDFLVREQIILSLEHKNLDKVKSYLNLCSDLARKELCNSTLPFVLFSDVFNSLTIQSCELFFSFMEECVLKFKDTSIFGAGRTLLLRICNDLLRRLSKSQNTVFCGKIQIFLSRLFPLDEKSGLNLMGHFNVDNITPFNDFEDLCEEEDDAFSIDLTEEILTEDTEVSTALKANKGFYRKFWFLQDFFRNPIQCYEETKFVLFSSSVDEVLSFFAKFRVNLHSSYDESLKADWSSFSSADMTFTKYLTNEKLFDLQLMDPNFRRCVLVQLAVTFQFLLSTTKFKSADQVLNAEQKTWVDKSQVELMKLVEGLSNIKERFKDILNQVLVREQLKSQWKNDGCPSFVKKRKLKDNLGTERANEKSKSRILVDKDGRRIISFATNTELTRLWKICPDNLAACKNPERVIDPELTEYFANARMELDPSQKVEEQYKSINNDRWCWSSLRLLSRKSQHFYTNWQNPGQPIKNYITTIILEKLQPTKNDVVTEEDSLMQTSLSPRTTTDCAEDILLPHIDELALIIGDRGKVVGEALLFHESDLSQFELQIKTEEDHFITSNKMMLNLWLEGKSSLKPSLANLVSSLETAGLEDLLVKVKSWSE